MAKTSGKSTKKSGNTKKTGKDAPKKAAPSKPKGKKAPTKKLQTPKEKSEPKADVPKANILTCQFCQKPMKDRKTLLLHERNCKPKDDSESQKKLETEMFRLKDQFDDERQSIMDSFQKREDALQKELDEMRTVLRMEIDKHRKELEMIRQVEKEVKEVAVKQAAPETHLDPPVPVMQDRPLQPEPKAIDLIPTPLPDIPKRAPEPAVVESIPEPVPEPAPTKIAEEMEITQPTQVQMPGISKEEIEEMVKGLVQNFKPNEPAAAVGNVRELEEISTRMRQLGGRLDGLDSKLERYNSEMKRAMERFERESNIKRLEKEMVKVQDKVEDMMEDIGFGEDLSVSKIPPTILEIVYQATLDDILFEIMRSKGPQDAETIAREALEQVRMKTSGSELFKFDGRKIVTDNLARSIEANLISAKQIQTTYDVLLEKLLETVPHHKAKNFKGMIKVKSQEFAVDRATVLTKNYSRLEKVVESTSQMVAAISAQGNARHLELVEAIEDVKNNLLASKASIDDIELLKLKLQERDEKDAELGRELALLKAELEMKDLIKAKEEDEGPFIIAPGETIDAEEIIEDDKKKAEVPVIEVKPAEEVPAKVLEAISKGASSKTAIMRETGLDEEPVMEAIGVLVDDKKVTEQKAGKRVKYLTPEQDMDEKIKADGKKKARKSKKTTEEKPPEPVKEEGLAEEALPDKEEPKPATKKTQKKAAPKKEMKKPETPKPEGPEAKPESGKKAKQPKKEKKKPELPKPEGPEEKPEPGKKAKQPKKENKEPEKVVVEPEEVIKEDEPAATPDESKKPVKDEPKKEAAESPKEEKKEPEKAPPTEEKHIDDDLPVITKSLEELTDDEKRVLDAVSEEGMSISGIQSKVGKDLKRFALLRALRVLIDSGYVGIITRGRLELYQKLNVKKMDKPDTSKNKTEVK